MRYLLFLLLGLPCLSLHAQIAPDEAEEPKPRTFFVLPTLTYSTDTGIGGGLTVFKAYHTDRSRASSIQTGVLYTEKKQVVSSFTLDHQLANPRNRLFLSVRYIKFPTNFYGVGNETPNDNPESYTPEYVRALAFFERNLVWNIRLQTGGYLRKQALVKRESGGLLDTGAANHSRGRLDAGPVVSLLRDTRDNTHSTRTGGMYLARYWGFPWQDRGRSFNSVTLEARQFFNPLSSVVFAFQAMLEDSGGDVPFYLLSRLGGEELLRGYEYERFRDRSMALLQHEIRFPLLGSIGGALFIAAGRVAPNAEDLLSGNYHVGYGAGIRHRFNPNDTMLMRFDYAKGEDADGWYVSFGEAF